MGEMVRVVSVGIFSKWGQSTVISPELTVQNRVLIKKSQFDGLGFWDWFAEPLNNAPDPGWASRPPNETCD